MSGSAPCALVFDIHAFLTEEQVLQKACSQITCWCRVTRRLLIPALIMVQQAAHTAQHMGEIILKPTVICLLQVWRFGSMPK